MKPNPKNCFGRSIFFSIAASAASMLGVSYVHAAALTWDADAGTPGAQDGAGIFTWTTGAGNWLNTTTATDNVNWTASDTATFGAGTDGTYSVPVVGDITFGAIIFSNSGYTLNAALAQVISGSGSITIANGKSATTGTNVELNRTGAYSVTGGGTLNVTGTGASLTTGASIATVSGSKVVVGTGGAFSGQTSMVIGNNTSAAELEVNGGAVNPTTTSNSNLILANGAGASSGSAIITLTDGSITNSLIGGTVRFGPTTANTGTSIFHLDGGTLTLSGSNTYNGATSIQDGTVSAAKIVVSGGDSSFGNATSAVAVNGTSTLGGSGSIGGNVSVAAAAKLAPGASAAGTLTGNLDISAMAGGAGQLEFELGALAGTNDQMVVSGNPALGALALDDLAVTNLGGLLQAGTYSLITSTGLSGTVDGSTALIATGFNGNLQTNGNNLELVVTTVGGSAYDTWADANAPTTGNDPAADEDVDGVSNGVEFVLGGTIGTNDLEKLPEIATDGTNMTFTFERDPASIDPGNTTVTIEVSTDLAIWNIAPSPYPLPDGATGVVNPGVTVVKGVLPADPDTITLTVPQTGTKKFARLKVDISTR